MAPRPMDANALRTALTSFSKTVREPVELVLGGSAALVLVGHLHRQTADSDVVASNPDLGRLQNAIRSVEESDQLPPGWLNGSIQSYTHVLPPDYRQRCLPFPPFVAPHPMRVLLVSRRDILVMKFYAQRARDIDDIEQLIPTASELAFVAAQLTRIALHEPEKAEQMQQLLDDWHNDPSTADSER